MWIFVLGYSLSLLRNESVLFHWLKFTPLTYCRRNRDRTPRVTIVLASALCIYEQIRQGHKTMDKCV